MNIVFLAGSHPRHAYIARCLANTGHLKALVVETREEFIPSPPAGLPIATEKLFIHHFAERDKAETRFFSSEAIFPDIATLNVTIDELNTEKLVTFVNNAKPDLVLSYGIHKLNQPILDAINCPLKWNTHGGLSPWYRGVITHFWPSYFLEPQMTGMTIHELTQAIDGGDVIHQSIAELVAGDGVHDLACRAVLALGKDIPQLVNVTKNNQLKPPHKHSTSGRIWRNLDWQPAHLHVIYDFYKNAVVDKYLNGELEQKAPKFIRQF